jgi:hypothetical protein
MIIENWVDGVVIRDLRYDGDIIGVDNTQQRQLLAWFAREKPQMVREVVKTVIALDTAIEAMEDLVVKYNDEAKAKDNYCLSYRAAGIAEAIALLKGEVGE